ncbi:hypothetical protein HII31_04942 [Pseudocercospora fuligena]|uniref:Uncharacterized protein n=1 Tax=Pseudocercospora fuligena TaxID=685502 RepID=A0A8H6RKY5_9PEZI|nr:hypothetical protein HII31_04942 [Pseudocercospora fuligena]
MSELPKVPQEIVNLKLVCRIISNEIGNDEWHSKVWYRFPSTVAFIDILSQWPEAKVRSLRMVHVVDTPLPLYPYDDHSCYHTHDFADALPIFPGLQLDVLVVENIWLLPSGKEVDGWCLGATYHAIGALAASTGWKELQYRTGILGLTPRLQRSVEDIVQKRRDNCNEPDLELTWGRIRPQLSGLITHNMDGTRINNDPEIDVKEIREWYESHPEEPPEDEFPEDVTELDCHFKLRRGAKANYVHDGKGKSAIIESLMNNIRWVNLRENNQHLVDDGLDQPIGHL